MTEFISLVKDNVHLGYETTEASVVYVKLTYEDALVRVGEKTFEAEYQGVYCKDDYSWAIAASDLITELFGEIESLSDEIEDTIMDLRLVYGELKEMSEFLLILFRAIISLAERVA